MQLPSCCSRPNPCPPGAGSTNPAQLEGPLWPVRRDSVWHLSGDITNWVHRESQSHSLASVKGAVFSPPSFLETRPHAPGAIRSRAQLTKLNWGTSVTNQTGILTHIHFHLTHWLLTLTTFSQGCFHLPFKMHKIFHICPICSKDEHRWHLLGK